MKYTCPSSICFSRLAGEYIQSIMKSICSLERRSRYVAGKAWQASSWISVMSSLAAWRRVGMAEILHGKAPDEKGLFPISGGIFRHGLFSPTYSGGDILC